MSEVGNAEDVQADDLWDAGDEHEDDMAGNRLTGATARAVLTYLAKSISSEPDAVVIEAEERGKSVRFRLHVAPEDMGRVIGRRGRVAQAIRAIVAAAGARDGVTTNVDVVDQ